jgi:serine/threonine protein kinase
MRGELEALDELDHPNIVRVIELLESDDNYYIVMELMFDGSLSEILDKFDEKGISLTERDVANLVD